MLFCFFFPLSVSSVAQLCLSLCDPMDCNISGLPVRHQFPELAETHAHWVSDAIQPFHPLSSCSPPALNLSQHQGLFNESVLCNTWPKYWSFSISPSNEYSGLISLRIGWLEPHIVQGTLKSLLQHHSSKASILLCSVFFIAQLSHPYMTTGIIAFTRWTFVRKLTSLLFNMLCRIFPLKGDNILNALQIYMCVRTHTHTHTHTITLLEKSSWDYIGIFCQIGQTLIMWSWQLWEVIVNILNTLIRLPWWLSQ